MSARVIAVHGLRQVHLIHGELLDDLAARGLQVAPGHMGENITTRGVDLLALSEGTTLRIGRQAVVRVTGLRNPCSQIEAFLPGLLAAVVDRTPDGALVRKAGVMAVVLEGGTITADDGVAVAHAPTPHVPLAPV